MADNADARVALAEYLYNSPDTGRDFRALIKRAIPNAPIPEYDMEQRVAADLGKLREENATLRQELVKDRNALRRDAAHRALIERGLATREDIPAIEKLMTDKGILDWESAASLHRAATQVAPATPSYGYPGIEIPGVMAEHDDFFKRLNVDDPAQRDRVARQEAYRVLDDFKNGRADKWRDYVAV